MNRIAYVTLVVAVALGVIGVKAQEPRAGGTQKATGAVKSVGGASFELDGARSSMSFKVDENTYILAKGAGTKTRAKKAAGQGGLTIADVVHEGDGVVVEYVEAGGSFLATLIEVRNPRPASARQVK